MQARLSLVVALAVITPCLAQAGDASRYTLNLTGEGVRFTATMNGIPVGPSGNPAESLAYSVDPFMHNGPNRLVVTIDRPGAEGAAAVVLVGPGTGAFELGGGPRLATFACNPVAGEGVPACGAHDLFDTGVQRGDAPDLRLWHASALPAGARPADEIAAALAALTGELAAAARARDWGRLFYLTDIRKDDMERANPSIGDDEAAMAAAMLGAPAGKLTVMPPPHAAELAVTALPGSLWSVQRADGSALLRIATADKAVKGTPDPESFGDLPERWGGGVVQLRVAVFGVFDGRWQLVR